MITVNNQVPIQTFYAKYISDNKNVTTGLMETDNFPVNFPNVDKTKYARQGGICVGTMNYGRDINGNTFMRKY
jgi:hypothetical protein